MIGKRAGTHSGDFEPWTFHAGGKLLEGQLMAEGVEKVFWRSDRAIMIHLGAFTDNIDSRRTLRTFHCCAFDIPSPS